MKRQQKAVKKGPRIVAMASQKHSQSSLKADNKWKMGNVCANNHWDYSLRSIAQQIQERAIKTLQQEKEWKNVRSNKNYHFIVDRSFGGIFAKYAKKELWLGRAFIVSIKHVCSSKLVCERKKYIPVKFKDTLIKFWLLVNWNFKRISNIQHIWFAYFQFLAFWSNKKWRSIWKRGWLGK